MHIILQACIHTYNCFVCRVQLVLTTRPNSPSMSPKPMLPRDLEGNLESRLKERIRYVLVPIYPLTHTHTHYGGPVGHTYEQWFESKNKYEPAKSKMS